MLYKKGQNIREYIETNADEINSFVQKDFSWRLDVNGNSRLDSLDVTPSRDFSATVERIPERLNRSIIQNLYIEDLYTGFIATLLWGGFHTFVYTKSRFARIASQPKEAFTEKLRNIDRLIEDNRISDCYRSLLKGESNYFSGIGVRYFTKIMFFLGQIHGNSPAPLIFDQFSWNNHLALLIADDQVSDYYRIDGQKKTFTANDRTWLECYLDYNARMSSFICVNSSSQLESVLFGSPSRQKNDLSNPRTVVKHILSDYFNSL